MDKTKEKFLQIEGMTCTNCALGVQKIIEKNGGENCVVNFSTGEAKFSLKEGDSGEKIVSGINAGGYKVIEEEKRPKYAKVEKLFAFCTLFTIPLFAHMFAGHDSFLNNPIFQIIMTIPVLFSGGFFFTKSAFNSIKNGVPNMDVLVTIGIWSAFFYSLWGVLTHWGLPTLHNFLFFETTATVTTLVLLGNVIEHRSVQQTTSAIRDLQQLRPLEAKRINGDQIEIVPIKDLSIGDHIRVNQGDQIPLDGNLKEGELSVDESMISGESEPVYKKEGDIVIGGTIVLEGNARISCKNAVGHGTLDKIIELVKTAQENEPNIQKLGDKISAIFVPVVLSISILTFLITFFALSLGAEESIMRAIAVLVISCPCAMGLAAPTAVMVGIGKAAKKGILIKGGQSLEKLAKGDCIVFDKTGTITTGSFSIKNLKIHEESIETVRGYLYELSSFSSHPISRSILRITEQLPKERVHLEEIEEIKGVGLRGKVETLDIRLISSKQFMLEFKQTVDADLLLLKNNTLIAELEIADEIKPGVKETIAWLKAKGVKPILLSGDKENKCSAAATEVGIEKFFFEMDPTEKLNIIEKLNENLKVVMVGDGINDAPALAKSYLGISFGAATATAINSAEVVLLSTQFSALQETFTIGKQTYSTIKQNFFWAFFYNALAIPIAGAGYLRPIVAALSMAFSDVIVIGNSILLRFKKN